MKGKKNYTDGSTTLFKTSDFSEKSEARKAIKLLIAQYLEEKIFSFSYIYYFFLGVWTAL